MGLSADASVKQSPCDLKEYKTYQSTTIYKGGLVTLDTAGYARAGADTASYRFVGVCYEKLDNSTGASGATGKDTKVYKSGEFELTMTGAAQAHVGILAYLVDDTTVASTSTNSVAVGYITEVSDTNKVRVLIDRSVQ